MLLHEKLRSKKIILASQSPRRRQLIAECGIEFCVAQDYGVQEIFPQTIEPTEVPGFLSKLKSEAYPHQLTDNEILITADTCVIIDNEIVGKPSSRRDAIDTIASLSGRAHKVITGVTIRSNDRSTTFCGQSIVHFRVLEQQEIEYYVDKYKPYDKAGSYGIQEWIGYVGIERIEGSYYNVMGLPVQMLYQELKNFC